MALLSMHTVKLLKGTSGFRFSDIRYTSTFRHVRAEDVSSMSRKRGSYRIAGLLSKPIFIGVAIFFAGVVAAVVLSNTLMSGDVPIARDSMVLVWETPSFESADAIPAQALVTDKSTANTGDSTDWFYSLTRNFDNLTVHTTARICAYDANDTLIESEPTDFNVSLYVADTTANEWTFVMDLNITASRDCASMTYDSGFDMIGNSQMYKLEVFVHETIRLATTDIEMSLEANT